MVLTCVTFLCNQFVPTLSHGTTPRGYSLHRLTIYLGSLGDTKKLYGTLYFNLMGDTYENTFK